MKVQLLALTLHLMTVWKLKVIENNLWPDLPWLYNRTDSIIFAWIILYKFTNGKNKKLQLKMDQWKNVSNVFFQ